jgi:hypothetical protein
MSQGNQPGNEKKKEDAKKRNKKSPLRPQQEVEKEKKVQIEVIDFQQSPLIPDVN